MHKGNFDGQMRVSKNMKEELNWWFSNIMSQKRIINRGNPDMTIIRGASNMDEEQSKKILRNDNEKIHHINYLELMTIFWKLSHFVNP